jgi:hypothetical protein
VCERLLLVGRTKPLLVEDRRRNINGSTVVKNHEKNCSRRSPGRHIGVSTIRVQYSENWTDKRQI